MGCGSILREAAEDGGLSAEALGAAVDGALPSVVETVSPEGWPKPILPFPKENLFMSFPAEAQQTNRMKIGGDRLPTMLLSWFYLAILASLKQNQTLQACKRKQNLCLKQRYH